MSARLGSHGDAPSDSGRRWPFVVIAAIGAALGGLGGVSHWLFAVSDAHLVLIDTLVSCFAAIAWAGRFAIHLKKGYFRRCLDDIDGSELKKLYRQLRGLVVADGLLLVLWPTGDVLLFLYPIVWAQCLVSFVVVSALLVIASKTEHVAVTQLELPSGSEAVSRAAPVKQLGEIVSRIPFIKVLARASGNHTPFGAVSALTVMIGIIVVATAVSTVPKTARVAWQLVSSLQPKRGNLKNAVATTTATSATTTATAPTTTTLTSTATTTTTTQAVDDYSVYCHFVPGVGAPEPERTAMHIKVYGSSTLQIDGLGGKVTGCLQPAEQVSGQPDLYFSVGYCGSDVRSLTLARSDGSATTLLQAPARFAYRHALDGTLVWAGERRDVGHGNLEVVDTTEGAYVFVRQESASGTTTPAPGSLWCDRFTSQNVAFSVIPPQLGVLWLQLVRHLGHWVWIFEDHSQRGAHAFLIQDDRSRVFIGWAICLASTCTLSVGGDATTYRGYGEVTTDELLEWAPPKAS